MEIHLSDKNKYNINKLTQELINNRIPCSIIDSETEYVVEYYNDYDRESILNILSEHIPEDIYEYSIDDKIRDLQILVASLYEDKI